MAIAALTGTLREMGEALEGKEVALQNVGAALREKEASFSSLEEAARAQREEAWKSSFSPRIAGVQWSDTIESTLWGMATGIAVVLDIVLHPAEITLVSCQPL